jgi:hypothetical protein
MERFEFPKSTWLYHEHTAREKLYFIYIKERRQTLKKFVATKAIYVSKGSCSGPAPFQILTAVVELCPLGRSAYQESLSHRHTFIQDPHFLALGLCTAENCMDGTYSDM